ncbi:uncharacterized protein M421DRAFT_7755 [Didymella exigua CBS 183.55]|uniref:WSC domain-containing protein n=1 Tax=Didymella exigua CBS 183.55 TaxID=1150837 RepID=A0A6A5RDJ1_9PLEO|nr:uncharacterized protein M421DRAFT_7755 [Didymella exigua CBS 183.55]KAF1925742.1 hypothetical protein M421DRAFT_7755 [Didymella exigua CBS 183.55]
MFAAIITLWFAVLATAQSTGFTQSYCSSQNTASGDAYFWTYQSNGECTDHCKASGTWAFAVIQYTDCWCSNYIPSTTTDISDCQKDCPGYPAEKCGDKDAGLYIYIEMSGQPSGTAGGSQSSSTSSSSNNKISSTLKTSASSFADAPSTSVQVTTESGAVVTRTVIYQPTESAQQTSSAGSGSSNTGAIVGGVVGGIAAIAGIVGGVLFFLWRRRKQQRAEQEHQAGITRNTSTMSKSGLLGGRGAATDPHYPPPIATNGSNAGSRHDNESISPISGSQRRYSQPMMIDSRLNPETVLMYHPTFANSRESLGSIDDSRDYGRQLNVRNPDPH